MIYQTSKDYEKLYDLVNVGHEIICYATLNLGMTEIRDVRTTMKGEFGHLFIAGTAIFSRENQKELFLKECQNLNIEWVIPHSIEINPDERTLFFEQKDLNIKGFVWDMNKL